jgi:hypothetical protein
MKQRISLEEKNAMLLKRYGYTIKLKAENKCKYAKTSDGGKCSDFGKFEHLRTPEGEQVLSVDDKINNK